MTESFNDKIIEREVINYKGFTKVLKNNRS